MMRDVVIAGAGPTGLMLASELGVAGVRATVLEKLPAPTGLSKALGLQARTMEMLDHRGLLERFAKGRRSPPFANFAVFQMDLRAFPFNHPYGIIIPQADVEALLAERATEVGAEIRRGHEVTGVTQEDDVVVVSISGPDGRYEERCKYVVGCDGGHSTVRHLAGIAFPGVGPTVVARFADVTLGDEAWPVLKRAAPEFRERDFGVARTSNGNVAVVPLGPGVHRVAAIEWDQGLDRDAPMSLQELQEALRRVIGTELSMSNPKWMTRATDNSRQAERYRAGRLFLAGDAAHVHFAYGGMGLQTGVQDAGNLGWKLAAAVQGWAPPDLLDSYDAERQPVGRRVLMSTRAATALARPGEHVTALREVFSELLRHEPAHRNILEMITSVDVHYDMGVKASERQGLVGRWAPDLALMTSSGRTRLAELMHDARGLLVDFTAASVFREVARPWSDRVLALAARCVTDSAPAEALLVRPDGYVAWACAGEGERSEATHLLVEALGRWFGEPTA